MMQFGVRFSTDFSASACPLYVLACSRVCAHFLHKTVLFAAQIICVWTTSATIFALVAVAAAAGIEAAGSAIDIIGLVHAIAK